MSEATTTRTGGQSAARAIASAVDRERSFRRARSHSLLVRVLRLTLPCLGILSVGAYGFTIWAKSALKVPGLEVQAITIDPKNLTMQRPKYDGFGTDGSHYVIRAKEAITDLKQTGPIKLITIDGVVTQTSGVITNLKATWGTFDQKNDILELYEKIDVDGSTGMRARLTRATVYPKESRVVSNQPVYVENESGNIRSKRMTMNSKARKSTFTEAVHVRLKANQPATSADATKAAAQPKQAPGSLGISANSGQPIEVKSERLDVDDTAKTALFRQDVIAKQGDAILQAPELDVLYEGKAALGDSPAKPNVEPDGDAAKKPPEEPPTKLKTILARGGVIMTNKDERATAETLDYDAESERALLKGGVVLTSTGERQATAKQALFDQKADTTLLTGDVLVTQGKNTMKGERLFTDRKQSKTRLESPTEKGKPAGRIRTVFYQDESKAPPAAEAKPKAAEPVAPMGFVFKADPSAPVEVDATTLDVDDVKRTALYRGNVVAKQGEMVIETTQLTAYYTGQAGVAAAGQPAPVQAKAAPKGTPGEAGQGAQLTRIEARQRVIVTGKDGQQAAGDWADFDVKANKVLMGGKVVVQQGKSTAEVPNGMLLAIDMTTGVTRFEQDHAAAPLKPGAPWAPALSSTAPAGSAAAAATAAANSAAASADQTDPPKKRMRVLLYPDAVKEQASSVLKGKSGDSKPADGKAAPAAKPEKEASAWDSTTQPPADKKR